MSVSLEPQSIIEFGNNLIFDTFIFNKYSNTGKYSKDDTICYINNDINELEHNIAKINNLSYKTQLKNRTNYYHILIQNIDTFYNKI